MIYVRMPNIIISSLYCIILYVSMNKNKMKEFIESNISLRCNTTTKKMRILTY